MSNEDYNAGFKEAVILFWNEANDEQKEFVESTLKQNEVSPDFIQACKDSFYERKAPCRGPNEYYCPGHGCVSGSCPP